MVKLASVNYCICEVVGCGCGGLFVYCFWMVLVVLYLRVEGRVEGGFCSVYWLVLVIPE